MNVEKMSDKGAKKTLEQLLDGLKDFVDNNLESSKELLEALIIPLDDLSGADFFGTEGWQATLGID